MAQRGVCRSVRRRNAGESSGVANGSCAEAMVVRRSGIEGGHWDGDMGGKRSVKVCVSVSEDSQTEGVGGQRWVERADPPLGCLDRLKNSQWERSGRFGNIGGA